MAFNLLFFAFACALGSAWAQSSVTVHVDVIQANVSATMVGAGIEDVNHELIGGIHSEMSYGGSFEEPAGGDGVSGSPGSGMRLTWSSLNSSTPACVFTPVIGDAVTGLRSQSVTITSGSCSMINRGLDASGLALDVGMTYNATYYARAMMMDVDVVVCLIDESAGTQLACVTSTVPAGNAWAPITVALTPNASTSCSNNSNPLVPCITNPEGVCIICSGALTINAAIAGADAFHDGNAATSAQLQLDAVSLLPDLTAVGVNGHPWRRDVSHAISPVVSASSPDAPSMGLDVMRLGGSMILAPGYRWKRFRGPALLRQPYDGYWYPFSSPAFGLFEFLTLCEDTGMAACVVTMNSEETLQDVQDLIQYAYGDVGSSLWATMRAQDGRAQPFSPFIIEIGNEQQAADPNFISGVSQWMAALNESFTALQPSWTPAIVIGATAGVGWPPASVDALVGVIAPFSVKTPGGLFDLMWDFHIYGDDPVNDPPSAASFIASVAAEFNRLGVAISGVVLEENGHHHDVQRALGHARQSNRLHCAGDFMRIDCAANGLQVQSRNDNSWDQGQAFFTQQETYLSPAGVSQSILSMSVGALSRGAPLTGRVHAPTGGGAAVPPLVVAVEPAAGVDPNLDMIALTDASCSRVHVRAVNVGGMPSSVNITLAACNLTSTNGTLVSMSGNLTDVNTPSMPTLIAPVTSQVSWTPSGGAAGGASTLVTLAPYSFTLLEALCACTGPQARAPGGSLPYPTTCDGSA